MGVSEISLWVLIRRYDQLNSESDEELNVTLQRVTLPSESTFEELKSSIYSWIGEKEDDTRVFKLRRFDNKLIPLSSLRHGSSKTKPFIIDIVRIHQFYPIAKRIIPPEYFEALKCKMMNLERRILAAENSLPEVAAAHFEAVAEAASQLAYCVGYLDRRLDELFPPQWKSVISSTVS